MAKLTVVGTTSWGTTLGITSAQQGLDVWLWARTEEEASLLRASGENTRLLPGVPFPANLRITSSAEESLQGAELVIIAVPSTSMRANVRAIRDALPEDVILVCATKGLEVKTGKRMSQVVMEELPDIFAGQVCALSGPNLAGEVIRGKISSTVIAATNEVVAKSAQSLLTTPRFRVYTNTDIVGVELGGALKNIIALGAGICEGLGVGDNAKAAFITRGLTEITRLALAAGGQAMTLAGLAGMGDLIATCSSPLSRNHQVGLALAEGKPLERIRSGMMHVAEGVDTTSAAMKLASQLVVEMPITEATYEVLFRGMAIDRAISDLMGRAPSGE